MSGAAPRACIVSVVRSARDVRTFHKEARSLAAAGWDVTVVGREQGPAGREHGVRIVPLPPARGLARGLQQLHAIRLALATRADVIQIADLELLPAAYVMKRMGRAVIYDCMEDYPAYMAIKPWLPRGVRPAARWTVERLERVISPRVDAVVTADEGTARRMRAYGATVAVVHNFPRRDDFAPAAPDAERPHDVLYHGSLPVYNLLAIAHIAGALARQVPATRWTIVGQPDSGAARIAFDDALAAHGVADRVRLAPRVPFAEIPRLVAGARTGVVPLPDYPKFRTNVPMKLFEFLAAGVPAVASDLPPARGLLAGMDAAILVPPDDHRAFADALAGLLRDPERARALGRRGREAVLERLCWEREEQTLLRVYATLQRGLGLPARVQESVA